MAMNPRLLRPTASGFNPKSISSLVGWWDAADSSTVTLNSGNVSEWRDKSGNLRHLAQTDAALQPSYVANSENNRNAVVWPSATNGRFLDAASSMTVQHYAIVCTPNLTGGLGDFRGLFSSATTSDIDLLIEGTGWWSGSAVFNNVRINGNAEATTASNPAPSTRAVILARSSSAQTRTLRLGRDRTFATRAWWGPMCELLAFSSGLSASQITTVQRYLARKWGVTLV